MNKEKKPTIDYNLNVCIICGVPTKDLAIYCSVCTEIMSRKVKDTLTTMNSTKSFGQGHPIYELNSKSYGKPVNFVVNTFKDLPKPDPPIEIKSKIINDFNWEEIINANPMVNPCQEVPLGWDFHCKLTPKSTLYDKPKLKINNKDLTAIIKSKTEKGKTMGKTNQTKPLGYKLTTKVSQQQPTQQATDMSKVLEYTFPSGLKITGTVAQLIKAAEAFNETLDLSKLPVQEIPGYYHSKTKGLIPVSTMNEQHLKNAFCYTAKQFFDNLGKKSKELKPKDFIEASFGFADSITLKTLAEEIYKRQES